MLLMDPEKMNLITSLKLCLRLKCGTILPMKLTNMQKQGLHKDVSKNKYSLFYIILFFTMLFNSTLLFQDSLNESGSATPNCFSRSFPRAVHNRTGMWLALCWGRSSIRPPTFLSCPSAMHRPLCLPIMNAKIHFIYFRYWQFDLTCWSAYSNHTKSSSCRLFIGPIPYRE